MCIFVASSEFKDYAFVLLDNRDEYLDRTTISAHLWDDGNVFSPLDASKEDRGTWIGLSKRGKIATLVNIQDSERKDASLSRGVLPTKYLTSTDPKEWIEQQAANTGGFQMLMGEVRIDPATKGLEPMLIISHKNESSIIFEKGAPQTIAVSNGSIDSPEWTKVQQAKELAERAFELHGPELMEKLWELLDTATITSEASIDTAKTSIFIPTITIDGREYGTRTQTIILVDYEGNAQYLEKDVKTGTISTKDWIINIHR